MSAFRDWMYPHREDSGSVRPEFASGVEIFLDFAFSSRGTSSGGTILCPCKKCCNSVYLNYSTVSRHLFRCGFTPCYLLWIHHGETETEFGGEYDVGESSNTNRGGEEEDNYNPHLDMVHDAFSQLNYDVHVEDTIEEPNANARTFFQMYETANEPLWPGHDVTILEWAAQIMSTKAAFRVSQAAVDGFVQNSRNTAPREFRDKISSNFRTIKNLMMNLGLSVTKLDFCPNHCFLYYKEGANLDECPVFGVSRYFPRSSSKSKLVAQRKLWYFPVTERLQRLYMSRKTAEHMTWHMKCERRSEVYYAEQATQVYYAPYPSSLVRRRTWRGIWAVCPSRARHIIDTSSVTETEEESEYYQDPLPPPVPPLTDELSHFNVQNNLADTNVGLIDIIDCTENDSDDEIV